MSNIEGRNSVICFLSSDLCHLFSVSCFLTSACHGVLWGRSPKGEAPSSESEDGSSDLCLLTSVV